MDIYIFICLFIYVIIYIIVIIYIYEDQFAIPLNRTINHKPWIRLTNYS
jgi:preprotein translocase subunit SecY